MEGASLIEVMHPLTLSYRTGEVINQTGSA